MDSSESGELALPRPVSSFKIGPRPLKLAGSIHCVGKAAVEKKKMTEAFGDQYAAASVEGVLWLMTTARISLGMHESNRVT